MPNKYPSVESAKIQAPRNIAHLRSKYLEVDEVPFFPSGDFYDSNQIAIFKIGMSNIDQKGRAFTAKNHIFPLSLEFPITWDSLCWERTLIFHRGLHGFHNEVDHLLASENEMPDVDFSKVEKAPEEKLITCPVCDTGDGIFEFLAIFAYDPDTDPSTVNCQLQDAFEQLVLAGKCNNCEKASFLYGATPWT